MVVVINFIPQYYNKGVKTMQIKFSNGTTLPYINAYALERDFKDGYTRPSVKVEIPFSETSFDEIYSLMGMDFTLTGDETYDENSEVISTAPTSEWEEYSIKGEIAVNDGVISFKVYRLSDTEIERNEAIQAVDELLLAMEV